MANTTKPKRDKPRPVIRKVTLETEAIEFVDSLETSKKPDVVLLALLHSMAHVFT